ncbi:MAG: general secretion pathway protein GspB [Desulfuromonadaceae bacterium]|nr:general secretion pathway protein GspB [Desulfuromonadaceae bacterium]
MSYILEALKKSEKKRQGEQGSLAHLATQEPAGQEPQPKRRPLWPLLLGVALVINAGVLLYIFWPSTPHRGAKTEVPASLAASTADNTPASATSPLLTPPQKAPSTQAEANPKTRVVKKPETTRAPAEAVEQISAVTDTGSQQQELPRTPEVQTTQMPQAAERKTAETQTSTVSAMEQSAPPVAKLNELPLSYRSQLPEMHMSVHVYSGSPQAGVVRINENMLRPGDYLDNRLLLEEITPDGAVFSYLGQWFLLPRRH